MYATEPLIVDEGIAMAAVVGEEAVSPSLAASVVSTHASSPLAIPNS